MGIINVLESLLAQRTTDNLLGIIGEIYSVNLVAWAKRLEMKHHIIFVDSEYQMRENDRREKIFGTTSNTYMTQFGFATRAAVSCSHLSQFPSLEQTDSGLRSGAQ